MRARPRPGPRTSPAVTARTALATHMNPQPGQHVGGHAGHESQQQPPGLMQGIRDGDQPCVQGERGGQDGQGAEDQTLCEVGGGAG